MSRAKVRLADNIARVIFIEEDATNGATLGKNLFLPDGKTAGTPETVRQWLGIGGSGNAVLHSSLGGLNKDDHPQYTMWAAKETIKGQWDFVTAVWGANGSAAAPEFAFTGDTDTGMYHVGANNLGLAAGGALHWDLNTTRVFQDVSQIIRNNDGWYVQVPTRTWCGLQAKVVDGAVDGDVTLWFWETDGNDPDHEINGFRWHLDGTPVSQAYFKLFRHNNSAAGIEVMRLTRTTAGVDFFEQVKGIAGSSATPSYTFTNDTDTGIYNSVANQLSLVAGGFTGLRIHTNIVQSFRVHQTIDGDAAGPSYSFTSDTDTGLFRAGADQLGFSVGGAVRATLLTTALNMAVPMQGPSGLATGPTFSFSGDPNTGMYSAGADSLGFSAGGTVRLTVNTTDVTVSVPVLVSGGSVSAPGHSFSADPNTGMFSVSADILGFATGGAERVRIGSSGEIGLGGANYGTEGQILTSHGAGAAPTWGDAPEGGGSLVYSNTTVPAGNTVANTVTETAFTSSYDIPANALVAGSVIRVQLRGNYGTDAVAPTIRIRVKLDSTTIIDTTATTLASAITGRGWEADIQAVARTVGATGTVNAQALLEFSTAATTGLLVNVPNTGTSSVDTTTAQTVTVTVEWGTADADNTITLQQMAVWLESTVTAPAPGATFITASDETSTLSNSRRLVDGTNTTVDTSVAGQIKVNAPAAGASASLTYTTVGNETASLANSRRWVNGAGTTVDTSTAGQIKINVSGGGSLDLATEILADSPTAFWKLDEASGTFADSSGHGNTLTASGTVNYQRSGLIPSYYSTKFLFIPTGNNSVRVSGVLGLTAPLTGDWSVEAIVNTRDTGAGGSYRILAITGGSGETAAENYQVYFYLTSGRVLQAHWETGAGTNIDMDSGITLDEGVTYHLAAVKDATAKTMTFYINGAEVNVVSWTTDTTGGTAGTMVTSIGQDGSAASSNNMNVGYVAFYYGSKLSATRIATHAVAAGLM
jgi:hypothetical protein